MKYMKLKIRNGIITDEDDVIVGTITSNVSFETERAIECASEVLPAVKDFINKVNSGSFKPRAAVKEFETILQRYQIN